jgi:hypothetical protein
LLTATDAGFDQSLPETEEKRAWEPKCDGWRVLLWCEDGHLRVVLGRAAT